MGGPFLAGWVGFFSPSMITAATAPRRPRNAHASAWRCHISMMLFGSNPWAISNRDAMTNGDAEMQSLLSLSELTHFRPLAVGAITMRIGAGRRWSLRRGNSRFDIFQFSFRFNPGTNGGNVEMGLIYKSYLVTLNQRVPGSSPGAPTIKSKI